MSLRGALASSGASPRWQGRVCCRRLSLHCRRLTCKRHVSCLRLQQQSLLAINRAHRVGARRSGLLCENPPPSLRVEHPAF